MFGRKSGKLCPFLRKPCIKHDCMLYKQLLGTHPQTGDPVDHWDCAISHQVMLTTEVAKEVRQGAAATESFRNEVVEAKGRDQLIEAGRLLNGQTLLR